LARIELELEPGLLVIDPIYHWILNRNRMKEMFQRKNPNDE